MSEELDEIVQLDQMYVDRTFTERGEKVPQIFKPGEYVLIKAEMTAGDERVIKNHSVRTTGKGKNNVEVHVQIGDIEYVTLQRMIKGWSITKRVAAPNGEAREIQLPYSVANIEHLPRKVYNFVKAEIERLNPDEDAEEVPEHGVHPLKLSVIDSTEDNPQAVRTYHQK